MANKFAASMAQTYVGATLGSIVSQVAMRGISGASTPFDFKTSLLGGLQTGTAFIAYPVACDILAKNSKAFKNRKEDPNANQLPIYIQGGMLGAAIITTINYPLSCILKGYQAPDKKGPNPDLKGALSFYVDQVGSSIGFATTMNTLAPKVPIPSNSLLAWARQHALVNISNVGGKVFAFPIHKIRHGSTLTGMVTGYLKGMGGVVICGDATVHFKNVLGFLIE